MSNTTLKQILGEDFTTKKHNPPFDWIRIYPQSNCIKIGEKLKEKGVPGEYGLDFLVDPIQDKLKLAVIPKIKSNGKKFTPTPLIFGKADLLPDTNQTGGERMKSVIDTFCKVLNVDKDKVYYFDVAFEYDKVVSSYSSFHPNKANKEAFRQETLPMFEVFNFSLEAIGARW